MGRTNQMKSKHQKPRATVHMINAIETLIMSPDHPDWETFCNRLAVTLATCTCYGDHRLARELLPEFGVDVEKSITCFQENGGGCDCEILLNCASE
jgi:Protein of unknown function (DUF2695)